MPFLLATRLWAIETIDGQGIEVYEATVIPRSIEDAEQLYHEGYYKSLEEGIPSFPSGERWLRLDLGTGDGERYLICDYFLIRRMDIYARSSEAENYRRVVIGIESLREGGAPRASGTWVAELPQGAQHAFAFLRSNDISVLPLSVIDASELAAHEAGRSLLSGLLLGIPLALILVNLVGFAAYKDALIARYVLYAASVLFYIASHLGLFALIFPGLPPDVLERGDAAFSCLAFFFLAGFMRSYLSTSALFGRVVDAVFRYVIPTLSIALLAWLELTPHPEPVLAIGGAIELSVLAFIIYVMALGLIRRDRRAGFFALAFSPLLVTTILAQLRTAGAIAPSLVTEQGVQIAFAVQLVLLSVGFADNTKEAKRLESSVLAEKDASARERERRAAFLSGFADTLANPSTMARIALDRAIEGEEGSRLAELMPALTRARLNVQRIASLATEFLEFARLEAMWEVKRFMRVSLDELARFAGATLERSLEADGIELRLSLSDSRPAIEGDPLLLARLVTNLIRMATQGRAPGTFNLSVRESGTEGLLIIGTAPPNPKGKAEEKSAWRPVDQRARELFLASRICDFHGARIEELKSENGRAFVVRFPLREPRELAEGPGAFIDAMVEPEPAPTLPMPGPGADAQGEGRILIVAPQEEMRSLMARSLFPRYHVEAKASLEGGIAALGSFKPDLAILDLEGEGELREFLAAARAEPSCKGIHCIAVSSYPDDRLQGLLSGATDFLAKPFSSAELRALASAHLSVIGMRKEVELERDALNRLSQALAASESRWRDIAYLFPSALVEVRDRDRGILLNRSAKERFGSGKATGDDEEAFKPYALGPDFEGLVYRTRLSGGPELGVGRLKTSRGDEIIAILSSTSCPDGAVRVAIADASPFLKRSLLPEEDFWTGLGLTAREREIIELAIGGLGVKEMEDKLFVSENTIKTHLKNIYRKAGVPGKRELVELLRKDHAKRYGEGSLAFAILAAMAHSDSRERESG